MLALSCCQKAENWLKNRVLNWMQFYLVKKLKAFWKPAVFTVFRQYLPPMTAGSSHIQHSLMLLLLRMFAVKLTPR